MELDRRKFLYLSLLGGAGALFLPNACRKSFEADVSRPIDQNISSIIFAIDISPSMGDPLDGTRKIDLVREALDAVFHQFKAHQDRYFNIETGLVEFGGTNKTLALAKFDYQRMHQAVEDMGFNEGTAIGYALSAATDELNLNATGKRSIILLTDGENNTGPLPGEVYAKIKSDNPNQYCPTLYFVPFNTNQEYFRGLDELGAKMVPAEDANQLEEVLIKISLEAIE